jgi:hypothetical protein
MYLAGSRRPVTWVTCVESHVSFAGFVPSTVAMGQVFARVLRIFSFVIIPPILLTSLFIFPDAE